MSSLVTPRRHLSKDDKLAIIEASKSLQWALFNMTSNSQLLLCLDLLNKQKKPSVKLHTLVFSFQVIFISNQINGRD